MKPESTESIRRRDRLLKLTQDRDTRVNKGYSGVIRKLRLILPILAICIIAILLTWPNENDAVIQPSAESKPDKQNIRSVKKNELMNPKFESIDEKQQPYSITAKRAMQSDLDENLILLEEPFADLLLNSGNWVAIESGNGNFHQKDQKLLLTGGVRLFHDEGYELKSNILHIDIEDQKAWSDQEVNVKGSAGVIDAAGLQADNKTRTLIFNGPAKLVLKRSFSFSQPQQNKIKGG